MPDELENKLPLTAGGEVQPPTDFDGGECFVPIILRVPFHSAPKPIPKPEQSPFARAFDTFWRDQGWGVPPPPRMTPKTGISAPVADDGVVTCIKRSVLTQMPLTEDSAESVAF
jgi:hypothetical protein